MVHYTLLKGYEIDLTNPEFHRGYKKLVTDPKHTGANMAKIAQALSSVSAYNLISGVLLACFLLICCLGIRAPSVFNSARIALAFG